MGVEAFQVGVGPGAGWIPEVPEEEAAPFQEVQREALVAFLRKTWRMVMLTEPQSPPENF